MTQFDTLDIVAIFGYLALVLFIGFWAGRHEDNADDYFLAGRNLPWYLIGFSFFASNMSGASFVGLMGAAYQHGMVVFNYEWTATIVLIFFALFILPTFLRAKLTTVPEYLEVRFDRRSRWIYAGFTILALLLIDLAGALYAGGVVISTVFPQVGLWQTTAALAVLAGGYTLVGGLRAVVATDALQAVLMIGGASLIFFFGLSELGGWSSFWTAMDDASTRLIRPADDTFLPWPGILGVTILGLYYWTMNQYFVQRALAARSLKDGQRGALFGGLLKLPNMFLMILPGMMALVLLPELDNPDQAFPKLAFEVLPVGLRGLILAALIAAVMSSLDSALNAASSLLTMDFIRPLRPTISSKGLLTIGRFFTAILIAFAALYAPVIREFGSLFAYFQATLAYLVPPFVAVYLAGLFWRRAGAHGAFAGLVTGLAIGLTTFIAQEVTGIWAGAGLPSIHFTYMALLLLGLTLGVVAAVSLLMDKEASGETDAFSFQWDDLRRSAPSSVWHMDIRVQSTLLFLLMTGLLIWFW